MTPFEAFFLGTLQGLTEFLPISSSGHLVMFQALFDLKEPPIVFDIVIHVATLIAVVIFFAPQIKAITKNQLKLIFWATIPTAIIGLVLKPIDTWMFSSNWLTISGFVVSGLILLSLKLPRITSLKPKPLHTKSATIIGIFQGLSIIPSISRSGATVISALWLGINKTEAFTFSFLISIPAILGATVLELKDVSASELSDPNLAIGFATAGVFGFVSLILLKYVINKAKLYYFGYYCLLLAMALTIIQFV